MLQNLPEYSECDYILREQFNNTICEQLKQIDRCTVLYNLMIKVIT